MIIRVIHIVKRSLYYRKDTGLWQMGREREGLPIYNLKKKHFVFKKTLITNKPLIHIFWRWTSETKHIKTTSARFFYKGNNIEHAIIHRNQAVYWSFWNKYLFGNRSINSNTLITPCTRTCYMAVASGPKSL